MKILLGFILTAFVSTGAFAKVSREHCLLDEAENPSCFLEIEENGRSELYASAVDYEKLFLEPRVVNLNIELTEISADEYLSLQKANSPARFVYVNDEINVYDYDAVAYCVQGSSADASLASWWQRWGRCTAGTLGGAGLGSLAGASFGPVGIGVGVVSGGLAGAAASCGSRVTIRYRGEELTYSINC